MSWRAFGPYEVLAKLGEGGMGEVYHARDTRLNRSVALTTRVPITRRDRTSIALTPDGRTLVIRALGDITEQLYVRPLDKLEANANCSKDASTSPIPCAATMSHPMAGAF